MTRLRPAIAIIAALLAAGCATYQPPTLDESQVATIVPPDSPIGHSLSIERIDGIPPNFGIAMGLGRYRSPLAVTPGRHTLRVKAQYGMSIGFADIWLVAEAGRSYRLLLDASRLGFSVAIVDDTTGRRVGGHVGDEEPQ